MKYKQQILPQLERMEQALRTSKEIIDTRTGSPEQASQHLGYALKHLQQINDIIERESDDMM